MAALPERPDGAIAQNPIRAPSDRQADGAIDITGRSASSSKHEGGMEEEQLGQIFETMMK